MKQAELQSLTMNNIQLVLDLSTRFFTRVFGRDPRFFILLKEWNTFKGMIAQSSIDLDAINIHLALLQAQIGKLFFYYRVIEER